MFCILRFSMLFLNPLHSFCYFIKVSKDKTISQTSSLPRVCRLQTYVIQNSNEVRIHFALFIYQRREDNSCEALFSFLTLIFCLIQRILRPRSEAEEARVDLQLEPFHSQFPTVSATKYGDEKERPAFFRLVHSCGSTSN